MSRPTQFPLNGLRELRERAGLTQDRFAKLLGMRAHSVWRWEIGLRAIPEDRLIDVARVLACAVEDVLAATEAAPLVPRFVDPADPSGWRGTDSESRDAQERYSAWAANEALLTVTAAHVRWRVRHGAR